MLNLFFKADRYKFIIANIGKGIKISFVFHPLFFNTYVLKYHCHLENCFKSINLLLLISNTPDHNFLINKSMRICCTIKYTHNSILLTIIMIDLILIDYINTAKKKILVIFNGIYLYITHFN
jgi:hypothetical protein